MSQPTYDSKCFDLAEAFLSDELHLFTDARTRRLAVAIQQTIEDFIADENRNYEPPDPMRGVEFPFADNH